MLHKLMKLCELTGSRHLEKQTPNFTAMIIAVGTKARIAEVDQWQEWRRELARMYQYYLHGYDGNMERADKSREQKPDEIVDIFTQSFKDGNEKFQKASLRKIRDDFQSQCVRTAKGPLFEFKLDVQRKDADVDVFSEVQGQ